MRRALRSKTETISQDDYNEWLANPVTSRLFGDLTLAIFEDLDDPLPFSTDQALPTAFERQGFNRLAVMVTEWYPEGCEPLGGGNDD